VGFLTQGVISLKKIENDADTPLGAVTISMGVRSSLRSSFSVSVFLHALLVTLFWVLGRQSTPTSPPSRLTWVELEPQSASKQVQPRSKAEEKIRKQLVQTEKGSLTDKATPNAFLGERTQTVEKQTVSTRRLMDPSPMGSRAHEKPTARSENIRQKAEKLQPQKELANLGLPILPTAKPRDFFEDASRWAAQGTGAPQDFVRGVQLSDRTALNTKEFIFFGYFQRIRERLDRAWVPILRHKLVTYNRTGRRLASDMDYTTKVLVTLNPTGEIVRVQVMGESGTRDLDEAAVNAFNQAGPFPNPPKGIIDRNGEIQIPWEFILKT